MSNSNFLKEKPTKSYFNIINKNTSLIPTESYDTNREATTVSLTSNHS